MPCTAGTTFPNTNATPPPRSSRKTTSTYGHFGCLRRPGRVPPTARRALGPVDGAVSSGSVEKRSAKGSLADPTPASLPVFGSRGGGWGVRSLPFGSDNGARRAATGALAVECVLQDYNGRNLVYHGSGFLGVPPRRAERGLGGNGGESLVDQEHRQRGRGGDPRGEALRVLRRGRASAGERQGQAHHDLDRVVLPGVDEDLPHVCVAVGGPRHGHHRGGDQAGGVAAGDTDAGLADVDADPDPAPHRYAARLVLTDSSAAGIADTSDPPP